VEVGQQDLISAYEKFEKHALQRLSKDKGLKGTLEKQID